LTDGRYSLLGPYAKSPGIFKCPADPSCNNGGSGVPRVRSVSMNQAVGMNPAGGAGGQGYWLGIADSKQYHIYLKDSDMGKPSPVNIFLFVDEHPDSINDGGFAVEMPANINSTVWIDLPAKYHGNACGFGFADGHAIIHKWKFPDFIPGVTYVQHPPGSYPIHPGNRDVAWVAGHTSIRQDGTLGFALPGDYNQ
jgi:hypothetical protein